MYERYGQLLGPDLDLFIESLATPIPLTLRINTLKISAEEGFSRMNSYGWGPQWITWLDTVVKVSVPLSIVSSHPDSLLGYYYSQGATSCLPPSLLNPKSDDVVIDLCAAPGSKTTQLAALMNNRGTLIANEVSRGRIRALRANLQRVGAMNTIITHTDGRQLPACLEPCDKILIDAPCSSS